MQKTTTTQIENRLKDAGFPTKVIPSVMKEIEAFPPEAGGLFSLWFEKNNLDEGAFDLLGITPRVIREKFHDITDVGVLIIYSHLVKAVRKQFASLCSQVDLAERIASAERDLGEKMVGCARPSSVASDLSAH